MSERNITVLRLGLNQVPTFDPATLSSGHNILIFISRSHIDNQHMISIAPDSDINDLLSSAKPEDFVGFVEQELGALLFPGISTLLQELACFPSSFSLLLDRRPPPLTSRRCDGEVCSFICRGFPWKELHLPDTPSSSICYAYLSRLLSGTLTSSVLLVSQLPYQSSIDPLPESLPEVAIIIPHRHPFKYLELTLDYVARLSWSSKLRAAVGLDVEDIEPYLDLKSRPSTDLYTCPALIPAGPYVFRDLLIEDAREPLIVFQDSDDVPCRDRVAALYAGLCSTGADMIGSHEVELNEIDQKVRIYRFPLDVSAVLRRPEAAGVSDNADEPFLHATAMMRASAFKSAGGFSTNRRIANDSQFLLRASFSTKIANVDSFLYIRRVHKTALTVAPDTHNGNALRKALSTEWGEDFKKIKKGELALEASSLVAIKSSLAIHLL